MFTGIVEETGTIAGIRKESHSERLTIRCHKVLEGTKIGDSIAVNGTCLTVTALTKDTFDADTTPETMRRTAFSLFRPGDDLIANFKTVRSDDVTLFAVSVVEKGDVGVAVWVVFDGRDGGWDAILATTEVDDTITILVTTADVTAGDHSLVVSATGVLLGGE